MGKKKKAAAKLASRKDDIATSGKPLHKKHMRLESHPDNQPAELSLADKIAKLLSELENARRELSEYAFRNGLTFVGCALYCNDYGWFFVFFSFMFAVMSVILYLFTWAHFGSPDEYSINTFLVSSLICVIASIPGIPSFLKNRKTAAYLEIRDCLKEIRASKAILKKLRRQAFFEKLYHHTLFEKLRRWASIS